MINKKIIIISLILISIINIISCGLAKSEKTNNNGEIYKGYASNDMWSIHKTTMLEKEEKLFNEIDSIKDKNSFNDWQSENPGESSLVFAIDKFPTEEKAIELISYGADVNMIGYNGMTPLEAASEMGYLKLVKELIKQNADVNFREEEGDLDALYFAVKSEKNYNLEVVKELLKAGADTDIIYGTREENKANILNTAIIGRCNLEKVKLLTEYGADINYSNFECGPVIAAAVSQECIDIVKYLVSQGVNPAMKYTNGYSYKYFSLLNAARRNKTTEIAEYLIEQGADINTQTDSVSDLPLIFIALNAENIELLKLLIEKGADTSIVNKEGKTIFDLAQEQGYDDVLALASKSNSTEVPEWDLEPYNDLKNIKDEKSLKAWEEKYGTRSLIMAIGYYPEEKFYELIKYGADINQNYVDSTTPLMTASSMGYLKLVKELIKQNADVNFKGEGSIDALYAAVFSTNENSLKVMEELLKAGAELDVEYGFEEVAPILIKLIIDYNERVKCDLSKFKMLVEYGADINYVDHYGGNPIISYAVGNGCLDIVKYLVSKGIDPAMKYKLEYYPNVYVSLLAETSYNENTEVAEYLIDKGADINTPIISDDAYPLILKALENENTALVKLLIEKGADTTVVNKEGKTVFDLAREKGYDDISELEN
ncbi:ankyrin repeat domain-containing protein [uncultured Brachyspira sp.]|uniref:ankyrin repeat domain-containing protein n=1 Tax=uncultured Brachyspira sp. TaxID=221953 RepID=UPI0034500DF2